LIRIGRVRRGRWPKIITRVSGGFGVAVVVEGKGEISAAVQVLLGELRARWVEIREVGGKHYWA
jgi:hypothetical protein